MRPPTAGLTLDTGALLALDQPGKALLRLLKATDVEVAVMSLSMARAVGLVCAQSGHGDVIDVHVVLCARQHHHAVATSDPEDIALIDPDMPVVRV